MFKIGEVARTNFGDRRTDVRRCISSRMGGGGGKHNEIIDFQRNNNINYECYFEKTISIPFYLVIFLKYIMCWVCQLIRNLLLAAVMNNSFCLTLSQWKILHSFRI